MDPSGNIDSIGLITQEINQLDRMCILTNFMNGRIQILIATDLVSVHGSNVGLVLIVDLPIRFNENKLNIDVFIRVVRFI